MKNLSIIIGLLLLIAVVSMSSCYSRSQAGSEARKELMNEPVSFKTPKRLTSGELIHNNNYTLTKAVIKLKTGKTILNDEALKAYSVGDTIYIFKHSSNINNNWVIDLAPEPSFYRKGRVDRLVYHMGVITTFIKE
jgi:predicted small secreted protein